MKTRLEISLEPGNFTLAEHENDGLIERKNKQRISHESADAEKERRNGYADLPEEITSRRTDKKYDGGKQQERHSHRFARHDRRFALFLFLFSLVPSKTVQSNSPMIRLFLHKSHFTYNDLIYIITFPFRFFNDITGKISDFFVKNFPPQIPVLIQKKKRGDGEPFRAFHFVAIL